MIDECLMTADCPAYDRERGMCLVHPDDCEFSPAGGEATLVLEKLEVPSGDTSAGTVPG
jgi:hypothetical protein